MRILFAAPVTFQRITFFISQYIIGLARAASALGHEVRIVQTTENMYNPHLWKFLEKEFATLRKYFKSIVDLPHDVLLLFQVLNEVKKFGPDILFIHLIDTSHFPSIMNKIKERGIRTVAWLGVHPSQVSSDIQRLLRASSHVLIYDPNYADYYVSELRINNLRIVPLGCDVEYYERITPEMEYSEQNQTDVCFVGLFDRHRERYLRVLSEFNLGIWSWNIGEYDTPVKKFHRGVACDKEMIKVIKSSKIALNIHRDFEISGGNYRLFEIPACGVLQIVDEKRDIGNYFEIGKEIVTFKDESDLKAKVKYYLEYPDEREKIARAGLERVRRDHSLINRIQRIINLIE